MQEFKAITNNAGAKYGRARGAVFVTSTKSGSNNFHGSAFEYLRNSALDAKNSVDRGDLPIPQYQLNQSGVSLGGPVIRNRTFFFADYEGYREKQGQTKVVTVPTAAQRLGNFPGIARNGIFDPISTAPVTNGGVPTYTRVRFPNDVIPASRFDPLAARIVAFYSDPQTSGLVNNYISKPEKLSLVDRGDIRIDHQITSKQTFFARYSIGNSDLHIPNTFNTRIGGNEDSFADWGSSNSDVRHRLNLFTRYELPFGQGKRWANSTNPLDRYVIGGWELDAILVRQSGLPFTVFAPSATNNGTTSRANVVAGVSPYPAVQTFQQWFNPLAISVPPAACYCCGNSGRNVLTGPRGANPDLTAAKRFRITESLNVAFHAQFFSALNHPQFAIFGNTTIGSNGVGSIPSTARTSRQIQFALRFVF